MPVLLRADQCSTVPSRGHIPCLWKLDLTETTVTNTTVETPVYTVSIPGGLLGASDCLLVEAWGQIENAAASTFTIRLKYGGTTIGSGALSLGAVATVFGSNIRVLMKNAGVTNAQHGILTWFDDSASSSAQGTAAIDSTLAQNLQLTVQYSVANANNTYVFHGISIYYLPAT